MATTTELYRRRQGTSLTTCAPREASCSTCGSLECVCRPRFFAGQVLHADDLIRLDAYIRAKHRLHNRQLHGWGVVNGLEVMCNPCGDGVAVGCGYALSPCGDDIVVCDAVTVAVCDLIRRCKDAEAKRGPCAPLQHPQVVGCDAAEEEWILAIRYAEQPQRGVQPLYAPTEADCRGGGATKGGCGCGCGARTTAQCTCNTTPAKPRAAPVQCEATVVCEGYAFEVYRRPPPANDDDDDRRGGIGAPGSPLIARFQCCYEDLVVKAPKIPAPFSPAAVAANPSAWHLWACRLQAHLLRHYQHASGYDCALLAQLAALVIPQPGANDAGVAALVQAIQRLLIVVLDGLFACLCSALLPPCPPASDETRVPLAVLHVAGDPCRVKRVCNWTVERKFATTFPALQYWLSVLPFGAALRELLQTLCCFDVAALLRQSDTVAVSGAAAVRAAAPNLGAEVFHQQATLRLNPAVADSGALHDASMLLAEVMLAAEPLAPDRLVNTLLGAKSDRIPAAEGASLPQFLLLNQIAKPMAQAAFGAIGPLGSFAGAALGNLGAAPGAAAAPAATPPPDDPTLAALRDEVARLQATIDRHSGEIEQLRSAGGSKPKRGHK